MGKCSIISVVLISIITYVTEIVFTAVAGYHLYISDHLIIFAIVVGFLVLISIVVQLLSWQLQSLRNIGSEDHSWGRDTGVVVLHLLQVGLVWRYVRILTLQKLTLSRKELWETFMLRTLHSLCCTIPILLLLTYLALKEPQEMLLDTWCIATSLGTCLVSCAWGVGTFRKHQDYCCVVGAVCPGMALVFKVAWRLGEVACRVLTIIMFVQVQGYWVFLVGGGHWITMLVLISVESVLQDNNSNNKRNSTVCRQIAGIAVKSYAYIFCYLNPCGEKSKFGTAVYYLITCLESIALLALWLIYEPRKELHIPLALAASISCVVGLSFGALYYSCYHRSGASHADNPVDTACLTECIDCHRNSCHIGKRPQHSTGGSSEPVNYETNWEQFIDHHAATASAANRLAAPQVPLCHNAHIDIEDCGSRHEPAAGYNHNVLMNRYRGQRSETPLVLMGYDNKARKSQTISHARANSLDFLWDNYDLEMRDHMHGIESIELDNIALGAVGERKTKTKSNLARDRSLSGQNTDQGYYSGISSSSKENSRKAAAMAAILERDPVRHLVDLHAPDRPAPPSKMPDRLHCRARDGGTVSDGNTSSYSTTSSKRAIVNCGKCGNSLSIEGNNMAAPSMYSLASSTSFASSAPSYYPRRRASIHVMDRGFYSRRRQRRRRLMERPMFGAEGPETLDQAVERIHGAGLNYRHHPVMSSDVTSSAWDYTDSEI